MSALKKVLRQALVTVLLFSILVLPAAWQSEAAATTTLTNGWFYLIQNVHSGKFLEVANGNVVVGANVWQDEFYLITRCHSCFACILPRVQSTILTIINCCLQVM